MMLYLMFIEHCRLGGNASRRRAGRMQREHRGRGGVPPPLNGSIGIAAPFPATGLRADSAYRVSGSPHSSCKQPRNASAAFERRRCFFQTTSMFEESGGSSGRKHTGPPGAVFTSPS